MLIWEMLAVALQSIRANLFRAMLTMLGIIIGVAAVIAMVALGNGAKSAVDEQLDSLGGNILNVRSGSGFFRGVTVGEQPLNLDDAAALRADVPSAVGVVPETQGKIQVKFGNVNTPMTIVGTSHNYAEVNNFELKYGRMFTPAENEAKKRVVVIGGDVPAKINQPAEMLLGENLLIKGTSFEIIGIFETKGSVGWSNNDEYGWVPILTAQSRLTGNKDLKSINVQIAPEVPLDVAMIDVERVLRREHQIMPGGKNDFVIGDSKQFLNMQQEAANIFGYLLAGIAGISLVVGGIGIMNIMLVTVTERTREIGIRKALGATNTNILLQFLIEAIALCVTGGAIGIALGTAAANLMASFAGWSTPLTAGTIIGAFGFSASIGLIFGLLPARKAAALDPIEALRYE